MVWEDCGLIRECCFCYTTIQRCNGFVLVRDYLEFLDRQSSEYKDNKIREICGKCAEKILFGNISLDIL